MKQFAKMFTTFGAWRKAHAVENDYVVFIERLHRRHPDLSLTELRHVGGSKATIQWSDLTAADKVARTRSFGVLRAVRSGKSVSAALKDAHLNIEDVSQHLGKNLVPTGRRSWRVTSADDLQASMVVYERGEIKTVITRSSADRRRIGRYMNDVQKVLRDPKRNAGLMDKYRDEPIVDADGNEHYLETDPDALEEINESYEESGDEDIYEDEGD